MGISIDCRAEGGGASRWELMWRGRPIEPVPFGDKGTKARNLEIGPDRVPDLRSRGPTELLLRCLARLALALKRGEAHRWVPMLELQPLHQPWVDSPDPTNAINRYLSTNLWNGLGTDGLSSDHLIVRRGQGRASYEVALGGWIQEIHLPEGRWSLPAPGRREGEVWFQLDERICIYDAGGFRPALLQRVAEHMDVRVDPLEVLFQPEGGALLWQRGCVETAPLREADLFSGPSGHDALPRVREALQEVSVPAAPTPSGAGISLLRPLDLWVGRPVESEALASLLWDRALLWLVGPRGVGKTSTVERLADRLPEVLEGGGEVLLLRSSVRSVIEAVEREVSLDGGEWGDGRGDPCPRFLSALRRDLRDDLGDDLIGAVAPLGREVDSYPQDVIRDIRQICKAARARRGPVTVLLVFEDIDAGLLSAARERWRQSSLDLFRIVRVLADGVEYPELMALRMVVTSLTRDPATIEAHLGSPFSTAAMELAVKDFTRADVEAVLARPDREPAVVGQIVSCLTDAKVDGISGIPWILKHILGILRIKEAAGPLHGSVVDEVRRHGSEQLGRFVSRAVSLLKKDLGVVESREGASASSCQALRADRERLAVAQRSLISNGLMMLDAADGGVIWRNARVRAMFEDSASQAFEWSRGEVEGLASALEVPL